MANRSTRFILKNNANSAAPFSGATLLAGEPIVNTAAGIMMFSGVTSGTNDWVPAGSNGNANFFEVGSNLYNLKLRNKITSYSGVTNLTGKFLSGTTGGFVLANISSIVGVDIYVTGGTISYSGPNGTIVLGRKNDSNVTITGLTDVFLTGGTYNAGTLSLNNNNNVSFNVTGLTSTDTFVTGFTYSPTTNTFTIKQNQGQNDLPVQFNTVSGLTISNLTSGRVPYIGTGGLLTDEAGFTYDSGTNTLSVPNDGAINVGTGGLNVLGDAIIQGSLQVFGPAISAFTSQLYVEDDNITLNYNPTGNTTTTSIGSGWMVQDGNGINGGNVNLDIRALNTLTGLTSTQIPDISEYTTSTGYGNRGWVTQLNDIVIRSTNTSTPNGVRVLAEFDTLDGGQY